MIGSFKKLGKSVVCLATAAAAIAAVGASAVPAQSEEVIRVLTFGPRDRNDLSMVIFRSYMKMVNESGKGVVRMDHLGGPEVVPLRSQVSAVSKGGIADWVMTFTVHRSQVPEIGTVALSGLTVLEERKAGYIALLDEAHKKINIKVIGRTATTGGFHIFSKQPIKSIADFKGMKIRSHSGYDPFFKSLGASPIHMKISEIYAGLERGLVKAAPYPLFVSGLGLQEVICCAMADSFWSAHSTFSFMNRKKWNGLSAKAKKIIMDNQLKLESGMKAMAAKLKAEERARLEAKGVKFVSLPAKEAARFKSMANDAAWEAQKNKLAPEQYKKIESMIRK